MNEPNSRIHWHLTNGKRCCQLLKKNTGIFIMSSVCLFVRCPRKLQRYCNTTRIFWLKYVRFVGSSSNDESKYKQLYVKYVLKFISDCFL